MNDAEYVLRFLTLHEAKGDYSGSLLKSMDAFMLKYLNREADLDRFRASFESAIGRCEAIWGNVAFRRPEGSTWRESFTRLTLS